MLSIIRYSVLILVLLFSTQGCMTVATSGASAVYNRRSIEKNVNDQVTTIKINQALNFKTNDFKNANIDIATFNSEVLLAGEVPEVWQKEKAGNIAKSMPYVTKVYNLLAISSPSSPVTRISDTWITSKIKAKFIASEDLDATQIKVVTENGIVYLMGIVKPEDAEAAVELARTTQGVQSVVKMFSYIRITRA